MTVLIKSNSLDAQNTSKESFKYFKEFQSFYGPWSSNKFMEEVLKL